MLLEDMDTFRFVARCLVYGDVNYLWGQGEHGLLLYWDIPQKDNLANQKTWLLTAIPESRNVIRQRDGTLVHRITRKPPLPEHWQLTRLADDPNLLEALDCFIYRGADVNNPQRKFKERDYPRLRETLDWAMAQDLERRLRDGTLGWEPPDWMSGVRLRQVQGQVALLRAYQEWLTDFVGPKLGEFQDEILPNRSPRSVARQREADLWTVLYLVIEEEAGRLHSQIEECKGAWLIVPTTEETMQEKVEVHRPPVEAPFMETVAPAEGELKCPHCGNLHPAEWKACPIIGEPIEPPVPAGQIRCPHCGNLHPAEWKACPIIGIPIEPPVPAGQIKCPHCGNLHPAEWKACPATGASL
jgi:uncharacterized Zn-finger protein